MPTTLQRPTISSGTNYQVLPLAKAEISFTSVSAGPNQDEAIFKGLAQLWKEQTGHLSVLAKRYAHPAYATILAMGAIIIPFILRDLQRDRSEWWFDALERLAKTNPAKDAPTFDEGVERWLAWGRSKNYVS